MDRAEGNETHYHSIIPSDPKVIRVSDPRRMYEFRQALTGVAAIVDR